jgi:hypothetical protein
MVGDKTFLPHLERSEEGKLVAVSIDRFDAKALQDILDLEKAAFGEDAQYEDAEEYYGGRLGDPENLNIFLKAGEKAVGYLLAIPRSEALSDGELRDADPAFRETSGGKAYYVETAELIESYRKGTGFLKLLIGLREECRRRNVTTVSMHARVEGGLAGATLRFLERISEVKEKRLIEHWPFYEGDEPTMYIEAEDLTAKWGADTD